MVHEVIEHHRTQNLIARHRHDGRAAALEGPWHVKIGVARAGDRRTRRLCVPIELGQQRGRRLERVPRISSPPAGAMSSSVLSITIIVHPGSRATSWARCAIGKDFGCGFQCPLSSGTRSSTRRVTAISLSSSGNSRSAIRGTMRLLREERDEWAAPRRLVRYRVWRWSVGVGHYWRAELMGAWLQLHFAGILVQAPLARWNPPRPTVRPATLDNG